MALIKTINSIAQAFYLGEIQIRYVEDYAWSVSGNSTKTLTILGQDYKIPYKYYFMSQLADEEIAVINRNNNVKLSAFQGCNCRFKFADNGLMSEYIIFQRNEKQIFIGITSENNIGLVSIPSKKQFFYRSYLYDNINEYKLIPTLWLSRNNANLWGFHVAMYKGDSEEDSNSVSLYDFSSVKDVSLDFEVYDDQYGNFSSSGGYGSHSFDNSSDTIEIPRVPTLGVANSGFINVYNPTPSSLANLGADLFPNFEEHNFEVGEGVIYDVAYNIGELGKTIYDLLKSFINSKLVDYVVDCHVVPVNPTVGGVAPIKIGFKEFQQTANNVTSDYVTVNCGTLNIAEYYQNFIDYVGTQAKLYLPFVGFVGIEPEYFQNGTLQVIYRFNVIDGSFMCYVVSTSSKSKLSNSVIASYSGNCCVHIPITGLNYSSMVSGLLAGTQATMSNLGKNGSLVGFVDSALNTISSKPSMESSNSYNSSASFLGVRVPYLVISRQVASFSESYRKENGLPLNTTKKLSDLQGLTVCENLILNFDCLKEEEEQIKNLFSEGVYL